MENYDEIMNRPRSPHEGKDQVAALTQLMNTGTVICDMSGMLSGNAVRVVPMDEWVEYEPDPSWMEPPALKHESLKADMADRIPEAPCYLSDVALDVPGLDEWMNSNRRLVTQARGGGSMSEFKREERYVVLKLKQMTEADECSLREFIHYRELTTVDCVVIESKWDNHAEVWESVQRLSEDRESLSDELERVKRERDALAAREASAKNLMSRLIDAPAYHGGPRPATVQEFIDWALGGIDYLAARDARMKAEALEELRDAPIWGSKSAVWNAVKSDAAKYRKQSEGEA